MCLPGYGKRTNTSTTCEICDYGSWQPGTEVECKFCPQTQFYSPVDGNGNTINTDGMTLYRGSTSVGDCVPKQSQLAQEAGQAFFSAESPAYTLLTPTPRASLSACLASCPPGSCCFAQYDVTSRVCSTVTLDPAAGDATTGMQMFYKLPPAGMGAAASSLTQAAPPKVSAKGLASGHYAVCGIPAVQATTWYTAGSDLGSDARTFAKGSSVSWDINTTRPECKARCDQSNVCFGFIFDAASGSCLYRGGVDALATRAFFGMPTTADLGALKWAVQQQPQQP